jgi:hypothetical protein
MKFLRNFLRITKLDWERNQFVRDKLGVQNIVREIEQCQQKWLKHRECTKTGYHNRYCSINLKAGEISNDRVNDGGTNFTFRVEEQA